jgi:hypothetical protein
MEMDMGGILIACRRKTDGSGKALEEMLTGESACIGVLQLADGPKKKPPRLRGFCRLRADILDLLAIPAAVPRVPIANVRFMRDVHEQ